MSELELDAETFLIYPLFALGAAATLGLVESTILPWFDLGETMISLGGIEWTIGRVIAVLALLGVIINRDDPLDFDGWGIIEMWTFYVTIGLIVAPPFFPAFQGWVTETPAAFVSFTVQSIGFALITYIN